ncbi:cell cycle arrest [Pristimantis euphronides]
MRALCLVRLLPLLAACVLAAPRTDSRSGESDGSNISNPFTPGEEHLSILHGYLRERDPLGENDNNMSRETAILRLFVIHDYDKSGLLDGLELMQLLYGIQTRGLQAKPAEESVISVVDDVLEKQDVNHDGLLSAQELVDSASYKNVADSAHVVIPPPAGVHVDGNLSNTEESENPEPQDEPALVHHIPQTNEPAPPPAEALSNQEDVLHHEEAVEEVIGKVEDVEMPGEEEDEKPDDEM